ncbi:MAG: aldo/keto reductase [Halieaceae bacterium]|jgi:aryl-alcohol dehydrogenase-like predicted oxidoreductase|nr:aldo/keto reductase [Halieaceae bacterium]
MSWMRPLGSTGMNVSALGLGTVKLGRDQGTKYPEGFTIPDDRSATALLAQAKALGINILDTAPAYGKSEVRLGALLNGQRNDWLICSKVGEEFDAGSSHFDFSPEHTITSIERSLLRLKTDTIDMVLVHSDGNDLQIINQHGTLEALELLKDRGLIRAFGMSTKSVPGGLAAAAASDLVMLTYNLKEQEDAAVLDECIRLGKGAMIKKVFASGHLAQDHADPVQASMDLVFSHPGTSTAIIGTIRASHLKANVLAARRALGLGES